MGENLMKTIENHRITIALGTIVMVLIFVFSAAYSIGGQMNTISSTIEKNAENIEKNAKSIEKIDTRTAEMAEALARQQTMLEMLLKRYEPTRGL